MNEPQDLAIPLVENSTRESRAASKRAQQISAQEVERRALASRLCALGVLLRLLTLVNGIGLICSVAYLAWLKGFFQSPLLPPPPKDDAEGYAQAYSAEDSVLAAMGLPSWLTVATLHSLLEYLVPALCGCFLMVLEFSTATAEASTRESLGFAFSASGRLLMLLGVALVSSPLLDWEHSLLQMYVSCATVGGTVINALLQGWLLACAPSYRKNCVASLQAPKLTRDVSGFPQVYQRDEGAYLHLGVLLPGFSAREHLTMTVNTSELELVGEIKELQAPYSSVDAQNSLAGPFGPFHKTVQLAHPVDASTPVEAEMKHGIVEYKFLKGHTPAADVA
mmetsp:Transcript_41245/g.90552  ORF Transcript_41245/g.90552 Transcript_41245/m.90552 type:complete len:336 (-) Transcript_41245:516-1523(-)